MCSAIALDLAQDRIERMLQRAIEAIALRRAQLFEIGFDALARVASVAAPAGPSHVPGDLVSRQHGRRDVVRPHGVRTIAERFASSARRARATGGRRWPRVRPAYWTASSGDAGVGYAGISTRTEEAAQWPRRRSRRRRSGSSWRGLEARNPGQPEFHQAVREVAESLMPFVLERPAYQKARILDRLTEPDRVIIFRVAWLDDAGHVQVNRGFRVQFNNAIGPYKGGLRFHPTVNLSVLKFLGFEQILKNSLTGLPMGGAKGGSNFDPKGKSDAEVMRFCQAMMTELYRHIGDDVDVPAGDIGVGGREIGFLFGQYRRITGRHHRRADRQGPRLRRQPDPHRSDRLRLRLLRREHAARTRRRPARQDVRRLRIGQRRDLHGREGDRSSARKVVTLSDSEGFIHDKDGHRRREARVGEGAEGSPPRAHSRVRRHTSSASSTRASGRGSCRARPRSRARTQNEIDRADAEMLVKNGVQAVGEGANMPSTHRRDELLHRGGVAFGPGKAANAGGVSVSGLEQSQNAQRLVLDAARKSTSGSRAS